MISVTRLGSFMLAMAAASASFAALSITPDYTILSGVLDDSNLDGTATRYRGYLDYDGADGDMYINSVNFVPGVGFDSNINFTVETSELSTYSTPYTLGTAISGPAFFSLSQVVYRYGAIDSSVAPGIYNFSVEFRGGSSSSADDVLANWELQLDVIESIDASAGGSASPSVIGYGDGTDVSVTLTNHMNRSLFTTTWYYSNGGMVNGPDSLTGTFIGSWFDREILPGQDLTDGHTHWVADSPSLAPGNYVGTLGVNAGVYPGDEHSIAALSPQPVVELIPEPASLGSVLAATALMTVGRRRKR